MHPQVLANGSVTGLSYLPTTSSAIQALFVRQASITLKTMEYYLHTVNI